ncbi:MAG: bis(5'-nucleosyl)-tetraphosphatase (symmetrical) YqeK [Acetobacteraceae bacterium]|nr:bis(5'-nucleosyl)-tetraphosphatase (symmetrical) YqeK [Acetobacteraceae bacterium]
MGEETALCARVRAALPPERYLHSLGTMRLARELALSYGADPEEAAVAGLVHDLARPLPAPRLLKAAADFGILIGQVERALPVLLHAPVGAELARRHLGVSSPAVLRAVSLHATLGPDPSRLDQVVYIADKAEPSRSFPGVEELRALLRASLERAVLRALEMTLFCLLERRSPIHPATLEGWNWLVARLGSKGGGTGDAARDEAGPGEVPGGGAPGAEV